MRSKITRRERRRRSKRTIRSKVGRSKRRRSGIPGNDQETSSGL
jgi:hypothetical protein